MSVKTPEIVFKKRQQFKVNWMEFKNKEETLDIQFQPPFSLVLPIYLSLYHKNRYSEQNAWRLHTFSSYIFTDLEPQA